MTKKEIYSCPKCGKKIADIEEKSEFMQCYCGNRFSKKAKEAINKMKEEHKAEVVDSKNVPAIHENKESKLMCLMGTTEAIVQHFKDFEELKKKLLSPSDIARIQGKPFTCKSGFRKYATAFGISDEITEKTREMRNGEFIWRFKVKATAPNGRYSEGVGACSSKERSFAHVEHDVYSTAHTRAKNRAISDLIGTGEISAEEIKDLGK